MRKGTTMSMTPEELAAAKRAAIRMFCPAAIDRKHDIKPYVYEGKAIGKKCIRCGYEIKPKAKP